MSAKTATNATLQLAPESTGDQPIDYLNPDVPGRLPHFQLPLVTADAENLRGFGCLVADWRKQEIEITPWPVSGSRPLDAGTGNEGGTVSGEFEFCWQGDVLMAENKAVDCRYLQGWSCDPAEADADNPAPDRSRLLLWHANYHPDGGQLFFPLDGTPFVTALALPGDDVRPESFTAFYFDGTAGLYIHPGVWHEAIAPLQPRGRFHDIQGRVHARVSCQFAKEFGVFLEMPVRAG